VAGWIKLPFGTEVDLGPGYIVLDGGDPATHPKRNTAPSFRPMSVVAKRSPISYTADHLLIFVSLPGWRPAGLCSIAVTFFITDSIARSATASRAGI